MEWFNKTLNTQHCFLLLCVLVDTSSEHTPIALNAAGRPADLQSVGRSASQVASVAVAETVVHSWWCEKYPKFVVEQ